MKNFIHYIPLLTTMVSTIFAYKLYQHWQTKNNSKYLFWWMTGVIFYGIGTFTESFTTLFGWQLAIFKTWYITGALLGGAPLAQGTVYLLLKDRTANILSGFLILYVLIASICIIFSPVLVELVEINRLSGEVFVWQWVRLFSPVINVYAFIFLAGGAAWSAIKYWRLGPEYRNRFLGNTSIAIGAMLPGIGGSYTRAGMVEVLYVTELIGIIFIWIGYQTITRDSAQSIHIKQQ